MSTETIHGKDVGTVKEDELLTTVSDKVTEVSGAQPAPGATMQDNGSNSFVWTDVA